MCCLGLVDVCCYTCVCALMSVCCCVDKFIHPILSSASLTSLLSPSPLPPLPLPHITDPRRASFKRHAATISLTGDELLLSMPMQISNEIKVTSMSQKEQNILTRCVWVYGYGCGYVCICVCGCVMCIVYDCVSECI